MFRTQTSVYDKFAHEFDHTRYSVWQGVKTFLDKLELYSIVADVGCGNGKNSVYRNDICVIGNDLSSELVTIADHKNKNPKNAFLICDGCNLPYMDNAFDATMSIAVIHHLSTQDQRMRFIEELLRITRSNGHILITAWAHEQPIKPKWTRAYGTDFMIPWHDKNGQVHERFYHLFTQSEADEIRSVLQAKKHEVEISFERDNWFIYIIKCPSS